MSAVVSQITILTIVYSTIYSRRRSKKTSKLRVTGLCEENSPVTSEFPAQRASNAENVSIWWRHHDYSWRNYDHLFPGLCWKIEDEDSGSCDEDTRKNQVEHVVEWFPPDDKVVGDVRIGLWTTGVISNMTSIGETDDVPFPIQIEEVPISHNGSVRDIQLQIRVTYLQAHIKTETKWPPISWRYFQMHFFEWKFMKFAWFFTEVCS